MDNELDEACTVGDVLKICVDVKTVGMEGTVCVVNAVVLTAGKDVGPDDDDDKAGCGRVVEVTTADEYS